MAIEIEIRCAKCGGANAWLQGQHLKTCVYCASLLFLEPVQESRFYLEPKIRNEEDLMDLLVNHKAEKKRSEDMARDPIDDAKDQIILSVPMRPLAGYLERFRRRIEVLQNRLIYVPYWHFQGTLLQCLLAKNQFDAREYQLRSVEVDEAVPAYDDSRWDFRDRGLRFGHAKLKEASGELLSAHAHLPFGEAADSLLDQRIAGYPALAAKYDFRFYRLCGRERIPIFRPYWIVEFGCDGPVEQVIVDACFGSVAGFPDRSEASKLLSYDERPYLVTTPPRVRVLTSRCPVCGWDTEWGANDFVHFCKNCGRGLTMGKTEIDCAVYGYAPPQAEPCAYVPFWKFHVQLTDKKQTYHSLKDYFRASFPDRVLNKGPYGDCLWVPAIKTKRMEKGDAFFAALAADATARSPELQEGPVNLPAEMIHANVDQALAEEIAACLLPTATAVPLSIHKLFSVSRMLRETKIEVLDTKLALLPYRKQQSDLMVGNQRFSTKLLE